MRVRGSWEGGVHAQKVAGRLRSGGVDGADLERRRELVEAKRGSTIAAARDQDLRLGSSLVLSCAHSLTKKA